MIQQQACLQLPAGQLRVASCTAVASLVHNQTVLVNSKSASAQCYGLLAHVLLNGLSHSQRAACCSRAVPIAAGAGHSGNAAHTQLKWTVTASQSHSQHVAPRRSMAVAVSSNQSSTGAVSTSSSGDSIQSSSSSSGSSSKPGSSHSKSRQQNRKRTVPRTTERSDRNELLNKREDGSASSATSSSHLSNQDSSSGAGSSSSSTASRSTSNSSKAAIRNKSSTGAHSKPAQHPTSAEGLSNPQGRHSAGQAGQQAVRTRKPLAHPGPTAAVSRPARKPQQRQLQNSSKEQGGLAGQLKSVQQTRMNPREEDSGSDEDEAVEMDESELDKLIFGDTSQWDELAPTSGTSMDIGGLTQSDKDMLTQQLAELGLDKATVALLQDAAAQDLKSDSVDTLLQRARTMLSAVQSPAQLEPSIQQLATALSIPPLRATAIAFQYPVCLQYTSAELEAKVGHVAKACQVPPAKARTLAASNAALLLIPPTLLSPKLQGLALATGLPKDSAAAMVTLYMFPGLEQQIRV